MTAAVILFIFVVAADQATKLLLYGKEILLIPGVIGISDPGGLNTGMAWGLLGGRAGSVALLSAVTVLTVALIVFTAVRYKKTMPRMMLFALALIAGGAIGNLIDRLALGGVRDFIRTKFMDFPFFNVADIGVTVGGFMLAISLLLTKKGRAFAAEVWAEDKKAEEPLPTDGDITADNGEDKPTEDEIIGDKPAEEPTNAENGEE